MKKSRTQNRLFIKIFLWFWLSFWLVNAVFLTVSYLTQAEFAVSRSTSSLVKTEARAAAELFERGGTLTLGEFLRKSADENGIQGFLFDSKGLELSGKPAPEIVSKAFRKAVVKDEITHEPAGFKVYDSVLIEATDGSSYIFVAETPRFPNISIFIADTLVRFVRLLLTLIASGLICLFLARYLTAPITKLSESARLLAGGNLAARSGAKFSRRNDEIGSLSRDFDQMAEQIEKLLTAQKQLLSDVSHELRTPLARLGIALELARSAETEAERIEMFTVIEREAARLNGQIEEILMLTKLENGTAQIQIEQVDLAEIVKQVAANTDFEAKMSRRRVVILENESCVVEANAALLRSAIENVVRNAVRYTAENSDVEVSLRCQSVEARRNVCLVVRDYGAGLPDADLERIFTPFYRAEKGRARKSGGIGLGLAIAANAVRFHHGEISAANASGGGLIITFDFNFPAEKA